QGWLLDQFVAAGPVYSTVADFEVAEVRRLGDGIEVDAVSCPEPSLAVTLSYAAGGETRVHKRVSVRNDGSEPLRLLEARLEAREGTRAGEGGGRGQPLLGERLFCGVEHPAGVNQGGPGWLRAVQMPGAHLPAGGTFESESVVIGAAARGEPVAGAFRSYV